MFKLYIINNENVSTRLGTRQLLNFTISATAFMPTPLTQEGSLIFQMIKDTYFNIITPKTSSLEFYIVAVKANIKQQKNKILDYFNENKTNPDITPILKYSGSICDNLIDNGKTLKMTSGYTFEFIKSILTKVLPDELILEISKYVQNVDITFMIHPHNDNLYISNPTFEINKKVLKTLIQSK